MRIAMIGQKGVKFVARSGGIEMHVTELAKRLVKLGHKVTVYSLKPTNDDRPSFFEGIKIVYIPSVHTKHFETIVLVLFSTLNALFNKYDILHYHGVGPATLSWIPRIFKPSVKVVVTFHSQDRFHQKWGFVARLYLHFGEFAACWFPHACISVSKTMKEYCRKHYKRDNVIYIPNGANTEVITAYDRLEKFGVEPNRYILNVGRIIRHKGISYLIDAFNKIKTDKKLVIVGAAAPDDPYFEDLKIRAQNNPNILMLGFQSGDDVKQLFAHAYLYVQPSEYEGLAVVVLEAMGYGTAVLVSDIPENLESAGTAGFSFKNKDVDDLALKLTYLLNSPEEVALSAKRCQKEIAENYNWQKITAQIEKLYRSLTY